MDPAWNKLASLLTGLGLSVGVAGCYIPGGGWTLRTGVDVRQICKPAAFVEMVDTKWDEWNRVSQYNLCENGCPVPLTAEGVPVGSSIDGSLTPLNTPPRLSPLGEQPASQRGREPAPTPSSTPADTPTHGEEVPLPPAPGNTAASSATRNRVRRRRESYYPPGAVNRETLVPASGYGRSRAQFAESEDLRYDRGPVTLDLPQSAYEFAGIAGQDDFNAAPSGYDAFYSNARLQSSGNMQPVIQRSRSSPQGAWVFTRP